MLIKTKNKRIFQEKIKDKYKNKQRKNFKRSKKNRKKSRRKRSQKKRRKRKNKKKERVSSKFKLKIIGTFTYFPNPKNDITIFNHFIFFNSSNVNLDFSSLFLSQQIAAKINGQVEITQPKMQNPKRPGRSISFIPIVLTSH